MNETEPKQTVEAPAPASVKVVPVGSEDVSIVAPVKGVLTTIDVPTSGATVTPDEAEALSFTPLVKVSE